MQRMCALHAGGANPSIPCMFCCSKWSRLTRHRPPRASIPCMFCCSKWRSLHVRAFSCKEWRVLHGFEDPAEGESCGNAEALARNGGVLHDASMQTPDFFARKPAFMQTSAFHAWIHAGNKAVCMARCKPLGSLHLFSQETGHFAWPDANSCFFCANPCREWGALHGLSRLAHAADRSSGRQGQWARGRPGSRSSPPLFVRIPHLRCRPRAPMANPHIRQTNPATFVQIPHLRCRRRAPMANPHNRQPPPPRSCN